MARCDTWRAIVRRTCGRGRRPRRGPPRRSTAEPTLSARRLRAGAPGGRLGAWTSREERSGEPPALRRPVAATPCGPRTSAVASDVAPASGASGRDCVPRRDGLAHNVAEMLMGYETDNPLHGRTHNPWDLARTPAVSGGEWPPSRRSAGGIGSDGGGSIRVPAHFTGICGLKPTPGRVPSTGHQPACLGPFSSSASSGRWRAPWRTSGALRASRDGTPAIRWPRRWRRHRACPTAAPPGGGLVRRAPRRASHPATRAPSRRRSARSAAQGYGTRARVRRAR